MSNSFHQISFLFLLLLPTLTSCFQPCPLLGATLPAPTGLSSSPIMQDAFTKLTSVLNTLVLTNNSTADGYVPAQNTSFSIGIFSTNSESSDSPSIYQYHHTSAALGGSTLGVKTVDENSVYRLGSVSKLFMVYTLLLEVGDAHWDDPITMHVPELLSVALQAGQHPVRSVQWENITLGDLATHMAGVGRSYLFGDISNVDLSTYGFPPLNSTDLPACTLGSICSRLQFLTGFSQQYPVSLPSTTPLYSNAAFGILAFALETMMNKTFESMLDSQILKPLNLTSTSLFAPPTLSGGVIVSSDTNATIWSLSIGLEAPAANMYSSILDMIRLGKSILSSSLLSPPVTRRWLKPRTHTSSLTMSVGAPWEIMRAPSTSSQGATDLYTKGGVLQNYASYIVLSPDYEVGFAILGAGDQVSTELDLHVFADVIAGTLLPALEQTARVQVQTSYAGTYISSDPALNSSLVISADDSFPGMKIESHISNGTDFLSVIGILLLGTTDLSLLALMSFRVYPTNLEDETATGSSRSFRAVYEFTELFVDTGIFSNNCETWLTIDEYVYGSMGWDELIFNLDLEGNVTSVELPMLRTTLQRT